MSNEHYAHLPEDQQKIWEKFVTAASEEISRLQYEGEDLILWGVNLDDVVNANRISKEQTVVLMKFLRARDWKIPEAVEMFSKTLQWRKEFNMCSLPSETFSPGFTALGKIHGKDKTGSPITYNFYGTISQDSIANHPKNFLRWRIQFHERAISQLNFTDGVETITQVHDYTGVGLSIDKRLKATSKEIIKIFQDYYPEFLNKKFFLGVPTYMEFLFKVFGTLVPQKTRDKFVLVNKGRTRQALLEWIDVTELGEEYGGFVARPEGSILVKDVGTVTVPARDVGVVRVDVPEGVKRVTFEFTTLSQDIGISHAFTEPDGTENVVPNEAVYGKAERKEFGRATVDVTGKTLVLAFVNEYSYLTSKTILYRVFGEQ